MPRKFHALQYLGLHNDTGCILNGTLIIKVHDLQRKQETIELQYSLMALFFTIFDLPTVATCTCIYMHAVYFAF